MKKFLLISLLLAVFAGAKTIPLSINVATLVTLEPGDIVQIDSFPMPWGYTRFALGLEPQGNATLQGFFVRDQCQYTLAGYYQQVDFTFDGAPVYLTYLGNTSINVRLQWWLDYSIAQSQCEEPSSANLSDLGNLLDSAYQSYMDLGPINTVSYFESAGQSLKISEYPTLLNNTIILRVETNDGKPLDGFVYIGRETVKISGSLVEIPLSRRSFLPTKFQISLSTRRKFKVTWWATYHNAQNIPVEQKEIPSQSQDSVSCQYSFVGARTGKVLLRYSRSDFADGMPPVYTAKTTLEGAALGMIANSLHVGTVYDIHANISSGKKITLAIPLEMNRTIDKKYVIVNHDNNGVIERIAPDSIVNGFVYFQASSCSGFWTSVGNFFEEVGEEITDFCESVVDGIVSLGETIVDGVQYVIDGLENLYDSVVNGFCNLFDPDTWKNLFEKDIGGSTTLLWNLHEGDMPNASFVDYNPLLFNVVGNVSSKSLHQINDEMPDTSRLDATKLNLDIMLSELINRKMNSVDTEKRFRVDNMVYLVDNGVSEHVTKYFAVSTHLTHYAFEMVKMLNDLYGALNVNELSTFYEESKKLFTGHSSGEQVCHDLLGGFGIVEHTTDIYNLPFDGLKLLTQYISTDDEPISVIKQNRDGLILKTTDVLARAALLAYYDKSMREPLRSWFNQSYKSLSALIDMMGPLMLYNNITIKAEAAMALYEYVYWGETTHFERFKAGIELHYGEKGGFSEGTGYLQYINEDVPYLMVALKKAFEKDRKKFELPQKFYESGYFLKEMSRNVLWNKTENYRLRIPLEIDDGCTYMPEYSVWGTLTGDEMFFKMAKKYPIINQDIPLNDYNVFLEDSKKRFGNPLAGSPLVALGYADWNECYSEDYEEESGVTGTVADGGAVINYRDENGEDYSITVVAENGELWKNGQAHDQQDNMSFTLSSTRDGHIVRDMGYSGFGNNENTHGYKDHNVLMRPVYSELTDGTGNKTLTYEELGERAEAYTNSYTSKGMYLVFDLVSDNLADYGATGAGGSEAFLVDILKRDGVLAYTFHQQTMGYYGFFSVESFENYRSIAYFGKTLWLFDQPSDNNLLWVVNGNTQRIETQGTYFDKKVNVYVGGNLVSKYNSCKFVAAPQKIKRADSFWDLISTCRQQVNLTQYHNEAQTGYIAPISMLYPIDLSNMFYLVENCGRSDVQCFERIDGNTKQRIVVPARGASYKLTDVLPDVSNSSDKSSYNGIMFAEREGSGDWVVLGVLNNGTKVNKLTVKTNYLPSNLLHRSF